MSRRLAGAGLWLQVALGLAVSSAPLWGAPMAKPDVIALMAMGFRKKQAAAPEPPPLHATQPPALTIPVEPLGFTPPGSFYLGMRYTMVSLDFLDENHLLFTFRVPGLIHRDPKAADASSQERQIRAVVLRLPEGSVQAETVWTLHDRARYLWMLPDGHFLLRDQDNIQVGDATLQLKPFLHFPGPVQWVEMDPERKYVVTGSTEPPTTASKAGDVPSPGTAAAQVVDDESNRDPEPDLILRILRRDTGKVMLVSHVRTAVHLPINSEGYLETLRGRGTSWVLNLNYFTGGSKVLGSVESVCSPMIDFLSLREFLVTGCGSSGEPRLVAMSTTGRRLWDQPASGSAVWPLLVTSPDGLRLARETLLSNHSVNASAPLGTEDIKGQDVQVFDAVTGKVALRAQALPIFDAGGNVAISPSNQKVAIVRAQGIQVFDLPAAPAQLEDQEKQTGR